MAMVRSRVSVPPVHNARRHGAKEQKKRDGNHAVVVVRSALVAVGFGCRRRSSDDSELDSPSGSM
jgi:hypothetical protein